MDRKNDLHKAIKTGDKEKILEILQDGVVDLKTITDIDGNTALHLAFVNKESSEDQLIEILELLLNYGCNINFKNKDGKTVLHLAVEQRMTDVIDFCLRRNADPNLKYNTIAHFLIEEECRKFHSIIEKRKNLEEEEKLSSSFVDWMVSREIDFFNNKNENSESALDLAIKLNLQHIFLTLLKHVNDLRAIENDETHLLCTFLEINSNSDFIFYFETFIPIESRFYKFRYVYDIVKVILDKDRYITDETLAIALRTAISSNEELRVIEILLHRVTSVVHSFFADKSLLKTFTDSYVDREIDLNTDDCMKILRTLVIKGADINEQDRGDGETMALKWFRRCLNLNMLQLLDECGADFRSHRNGGDSFLHLVSQNSKEEGLFTLLANKGCDVNVVNSEGNTPLHVAIFHRNVSVAKDLIANGANVNVVCKYGKTPLSLACEKGIIEIAEKIIEYGADLRYKDKFGNNLLHLTFDSCIVDLLLKNGVEVNAKNNAGQTPIFRARDGPVVKILFTAGARVDVLDNIGCSPLYFAAYHGHWVAFFELLKSGADILDAKVFQQIVKDLQRVGLYDSTLRILQLYCEPIADIDLEKHFVKLKVAGLFDEKFEIYDSNDIVMQKSFEKCLLEVELLKNFFVDDLTSLYNFLHKKRNRRSAYADNERLKNLVDDEKLSKQFPNYFILILGYYNEAVARKSYLQKSICVLEKLTKVNLPDLCTDQILEYLSNINLLRFIEAYNENINSSMF